MSNYDKLNHEQKIAVFHTEGPLLILAGAGSGKTRVLTHRISYLINEKKVQPWNIMAITFTNKAAAEMRERVNALIENYPDSVWVSTFHSSCVRILRRYIDRIGYDNNFTIYDADDQKSLVKSIMKRMNIDPKQLKDKTIINAISAAKNELQGPDEFTSDIRSPYISEKIVAVYTAYQKELKKNNALDFDDLIMKTVQLLERDQEVLEYYQEKFKYIMVDEYQDTNYAQFKLVSILADKYKNLCVVGDDDQSIYKFRGADIRNILGFEKKFKNTKVIKLEQNYRSTGNILNSANGVIRNNVGRKDKTLWTDKEDGEKLKFYQVDNAYTEAEKIVEMICNLNKEGFRYKECACLYRTNAQSRILEEEFLRNNIPYKIVGGVNFYQRKEIKDILAYLKTVNNGKDDLAVKRIINIPKRGIGLASIDKIQYFADERGLNFYDALESSEEITTIGKTSGKIMPFVNFIQYLREKKDRIPLKDLIDEVVTKTGYIEELKAENTEEALARIENIGELISKAVDYEAKSNEASLNGFLEEVALIADIDSLSENVDYVVLMTIHNSKGLEFKNVFLTGMEDGLFPGIMTITMGDENDMEEERRLCYVAITRAMENLVITSARQRMVNGETRYHNISRFVNEIPKEHISSNVSKPEAFARNLTPEQKKNLEPAKAFETRQFSPGKQVELNYVVGDTVKHIKFGKGIVKAIDAGGRDYEVTVDFHDAGTKKMFSSFANLKKV